MGLSTDLVVDISDELLTELDSSSEISIPFISFWLRRNIGTLNNLIGTSITINTDSPFSFSTALNEQEKSIYKHLFKLYFYEKKVRGALGASSYDQILEVQSDGGLVRMTNRNEISKTYLQLRNQEILALNKLVNSYKLNSFDPLQVAGEDYISNGETSDTKYTRALDKYVT